VSDAETELSEALPDWHVERSPRGASAYDKEPGAEAESIDELSVSEAPAAWKVRHVRHSADGMSRDELWAGEAPTLARACSLARERAGRSPTGWLL
jgi:hypothetical protein